MKKPRNTRSTDWAWKPPYSKGDINWPGWRRHKQVQAKKSAKRKAKREGKKEPHEFYDTPRWLDLRYSVLRRDGGRCVVCGRGAKDGVIIQVDHIKPRSIYPALQWDQNNLQVMCRDCNQGKSNRDTKDWR